MVRANKNAIYNLCLKLDNYIKKRTTLTFSYELLSRKPEDLLFNV